MTENRVTLITPPLTLHTANFTLTLNTRHHHIHHSDTKHKINRFIYKVKFVTKIWHPNISSVTGAICLDILKDQWAAAMTLRTVLLSLQALLAAAEPDDPQDAVVARQFKENHPLFLQTAQYWSHVHAGAPRGNSDFANKVRCLMDLGVGEQQALVALSSCNWDMDRAIEQLFS
nr:ubiquitin-conjugating enzyme E2 K-like [Penaeus vannamei]